jgi:uncharacterized membrane protein YczE
MNTGDIISLFGYYIGIIAILLAFFASQIDGWKNRVILLEFEWDKVEQKANTVFRLRQAAQKKLLETTKPYFSLWVPLGIGIVFLGLGCFAVIKAHNEVVKLDAALFLILPSITLLIIHFCYGLRTIKDGITRLSNLNV